MSLLLAIFVPFLGAPVLAMQAIRQLGPPSLGASPTVPRDAAMSDLPDIFRSANADAQELTLQALEDAQLLGAASADAAARPLPPLYGAWATDPGRPLADGGAQGASPGRLFASPGLGEYAAWPNNNQFKPVDVVRQDVAMLGTANERLKGHAADAPVEIVYCDSEPCAAKSAVVYALLHLFWVAFCGLDRCYLGNVRMGLLKGFTCGGCGVWAFIDELAFLVVCLQKNPSINLLGMQANFVPRTVNGGFAVAVIVAALMPLQMMMASHRMSEAAQTKLEVKADDHFFRESM